MKTIEEKLQTQAFMQGLDELKHVFLICAEFEVKKTLVSSKENNFKPCLTKQLLNMF